MLSVSENNQVRRKMRKIDLALASIVFWSMSLFQKSHAQIQFPECINQAEAIDVRLLINETLTYSEVQYSLDVTGFDAVKPYCVEAFDSQVIDINVNEKGVLFFVEEQGLGLSKLESSDTGQMTQSMLESRDSDQKPQSIFVSGNDLDFSEPPGVMTVLSSGVGIDIWGILGVIVVVGVGVASNQMEASAVVLPPSGLRYGSAGLNGDFSQETSIISKAGKIDLSIFSVDSERLTVDVLKLMDRDIYIQYQYGVEGDYAISSQVISARGKKDVLTLDGLGVFMASNDMDYEDKGGEVRLLSAYILPRDRVEIITRDQWSADESLALGVMNQDRSDQINKINCSASIAGEELVVLDNITGDPYLWPLEYSGVINKFIIHHTGSDLSTGFAQAVRDIYYDHTVTNNWGDIGYNYLVDSDGNVYEGRQGGDGVKGAHTLCHNGSSVGIVVMGDYSSQQFSEATIESVAKLITEKSIINDVLINGRDTDSRVEPYITGHRHDANTACPGEGGMESLSIVQDKVHDYYQEYQLSLLDVGVLDGW